MYNLHIYEREDLTPIRKLLMMKALAGGKALKEYTETGNPAEFSTNVAKALKVTVAFSPVQTGSGDPSPENIRPITGFTGANIYLSPTDADDPAKQTFAVTFPALGKNILNPAAWPNNSYYSVNGDEITVLAADGGSWNLETEYPVKPGTYTFLRTNTAGQIRYRLGPTGSEVVLLGNNGGETAQITVTEETTIRFKVGNGAESYPFTTKLMLAEGTVSAFEPYTNTAYGGTLDLTTGVLTVDLAELVLTGTYEQYLVTNNTYIKADACDAYVNASAMLYNTSNIVCNMLKMESNVWNKTGFPNCFSRNGRQIHINIANDLIGVTDYTQETTADVSTKIRGYVKDLYDNGTPMIFVYELATPLVYQLTPTEILSLVGDNVLWSDLNGDLTVTYKKKG